MSSIPATSDPATAAWLLDPAHPTVRRLAIARLGLEDPATGPTTTRTARREEEPWIRLLLVEPPHPARADQPVHPYQKWGGVHWRLVALAELEADPGEPVTGAVVPAGFERVTAWLDAPSRLGRARPVQGRARMCASQDGLAAWAAIRLGLVDDPRVGAMVERLLTWQWPDGGWNCDPRLEATHASFNESWGPLRALAAYAGTRPDSPLAGAARAGADRAVELLLAHHVVLSHRTGELADPALDGLRWPAYWHYDRLVGLRVIAEAGRLGDPRAREALDDLRAAAGPGGRWRPDRRWWRRPGAGGSGVEVVDWGAEGESKLLTLLAVEVLSGA